VLDSFTERINNKVRQVSETGVTIFPRITYDKTIVLQRKTWQISSADLPIKKPGESDPAYLMRITQWRQLLDLPLAVFVSLTAGKPQYVSFANPFCIALFERIGHGSVKNVLITEMLPVAGNTFANDGEHATELFAQWYS
jgi:hypothetical protein